jgi:hypothetical protein
MIRKKTQIRLTTYFSSETMETRRQWDYIIKVFKEKTTVNKESYIQESYFSKIEVT